MAILLYLVKTKLHSCIASRIFGLIIRLTSCSGEARANRAVVPLVDTVHLRCQDDNCLNALIM